jgi:hypothetical protein
MRLLIAGSWVRTPPRAPLDLAPRAGCCVPSRLYEPHKGHKLNTKRKNMMFYRHCIDHIPHRAGITLYLLANIMPPQCIESDASERDLTPRIPRKDRLFWECRHLGQDVIGNRAIADRKPGMASMPDSVACKVSCLTTDPAPAGESAHRRCVAPEPSLPGSAAADPARGRCLPLVRVFSRRGWRR